MTSRYPAAECLDTICSSTHRRQAEVRELAAQVDALVVVGGKNSANTRRLAEIAEGLGTRALHVETAAELPLAALAALARVGVTAGASTPAWIIEEVVDALSAPAPCGPARTAPGSSPAPRAPARSPRRPRPG